MLTQSYVHVSTIRHIINFLSIFLDTYTTKISFFISKLHARITRTDIVESFGYIPKFDVI